ncbi:hypothetical protein AA0243_2188 [Novacetimonas hansenii NRIC 0243]|nr:hypothetical protein AA0243_2188 [Novacetimonas hansenii NRIC 0243]
MAKAQALYPDLVLMDADPEGDRLGLEKLALWFLHRIAPIVAVDTPDGLVLDTTGADHLHGGELPMLKDMVHRMAGAGFCARAVVADTWGAAHALARYGRLAIAVVPSDKTTSALADLPVEALRLPSPIIEGLATLGVSRIGPLAAMPRAPLALRFGPDIARRLDQAFGRMGDPQRSGRSSAHIRRQRISGVNFHQHLFASVVISASDIRQALSTSGTTEQCRTKTGFQKRDVFGDHLCRHTQSFCRSSERAEIRRVDENIHAGQSIHGFPPAGCQ